MLTKELLQDNIQIHMKHLTTVSKLQPAYRPYKNFTKLDQNWTLQKSS